MGNRCPRDFSLQSPRYTKIRLDIRSKLRTSKNGQPATFQTHVTRHTMKNSSRGQKRRAEHSSYIAARAAHESRAHRCLPPRSRAAKSVICANVQMSIRESVWCLFFPSIFAESARSSLLLRASERRRPVSWLDISRAPSEACRGGGR